MNFRLNGSSVRIESSNTSLFGNHFNPRNHPDFLEYEDMGREIKDRLTQMRMEARAANAPKMAVVCPACRATTMPDAHGCCEYCGTPLGR